MRKFSARWWVTPNLLQWRYMVACGDWEGGFAGFGMEVSNAGHV